MFIGVRTPDIRALAKELYRSGEYKSFLNSLAHKYFDENQLHSLLLSQIRDFDECLGYVEAFLPYIDNWATCDQLSPKPFKKEPERLLPHIDKWIKSKHTYTVRFGVLCLMRYFLDDKFDIKYTERVCKIKSDEYYINMMLAWYLATALAKQYDSIIPIFEAKQLDKWVHNKSIQKASESYRVPDEHKAYLKTLKIR